MEINEETDPRALRNEMAQLRPGRFSWDARNLGGNRWTVRLERIDENADGETFLAHVAAFHAGEGDDDQGARGSDERAQLRAGDTIFDEGEVWPYLGIVKSGKVIYTLLSPDGKTHTIGERLTHDTLNESGTFDSGGATTRAEALTDATIVTLPSEAVMHAARNDAELALGFLDRIVASAPPLDRHDRRPRIRARACNASRSFYSATRARRSAWRAGFPGVENLSQAQIAAAAGTVRDMAARALLASEECGRRGTRPRPRTSDRSRAP